jgi:DNA polymerase I
MSTGHNNKDQTPTLYLIDGTAYIHRAYHAVRGLTNSKGIPTNAVFGFTRMLISLIEQKKPRYVGMHFDAKGPTFRHEMYPEYKANRPPMADDMVVQLPYIKKVSAAFNMPVYEIEGLEADDVMGTLAVKAAEAGFEVVLVTGDKDFMQLVSDKITIWDPMKTKTIDRATIQKELGIEPEQVVDMMGLAGDSADNVPGVPGIGPKTAQALIASFGNMAALYDQVDTITKKKQHENLVNFKEQAFLSRQLVTIKTDAAIDFDAEALVYETPDKKKLTALFKELEFKQLQRTFVEETPQKPKSYHAILDEVALVKLLKRLAVAEVVALDTETTSPVPMLAELVGISFAIEADEAFYIPLNHVYEGAPAQLSWDLVLQHLKPFLEDPGTKKIGQNIKYDWMVLARHGVDLQGVYFDTMLASYLLDPSRRSHGMDQIALDYLGHKTTTYKEVTGTGQKAISFAQVEVEKAVPYACEDADITLALYHHLMPQLTENGLDKLFEQVEMPLVPVLMAVEMAGICVDKPRLRALSERFAQQLAQLEKEIYEQAGETFNIKSSQQLGYILFEKLKLPTQKKTQKKTAYSTDVNVLTLLADKHDLPALVLRHRSLAKLKSTYTDALLALIHPQTGRIHTSFNQTVTATGRLSSSDPNLQNIPIRTEEGREIRQAFVPRDGWHLVAADYSQIELRILAHYSKDAILTEAFQKDEDIHTRTAAEVFKVFPSFIDTELRRQAKVINFGIIYGMGAFRLSKELGISHKMAKSYIDNYFARYKGVKDFIDQTIETARETGQTGTLLGRIRRLPDINAKNHNIRQFAERIAVNTPIQGTAADLLKVAMIEVADAFKAKRFEAAMLLTVHDELVFEVPPAELAEVRRLVRDIMEHVWDLRVPLKVNIANGADWAEAH